MEKKKNICWCCGDNIAQLRFIVTEDDVRPMCPECTAAYRELVQEQAS